MTAKGSANMTKRVEPASGHRVHLERSARARGWAAGLAAILWTAGFACGGSDEPDVARTTLSGVPCLDASVACGETCEQLASSAEH